MAFLIYKSSAGSGKTTALIRVYLRLSLAGNNPHAFKSILAITFTNKAANELKTRFLETLREIKNTTDDESKQGFMVKLISKDLDTPVSSLKKRAEEVYKIALRDYDDIGIGTIDGFNHKLIRSFSREVNLKSDFEPETDVEGLFSEAVGELLDRAGNDERLTDHLYQFIKTTLAADKKVKITEELMNLRFLITDEESELPIKSLLEVDSGVFKELSRVLFSKVEEFTRNVHEIGEKAFKIFTEYHIVPNDLIWKNGGYFGFFEKLKGFKKDYVELRSNLRDKVEDSWAGKNVTEDQKQRVEAAEEILRPLYYRAKGYFEQEYDSFLLAFTLSRKIDLLALLADMNRSYQEVIEDRNVLPVASFNRLISDSLKDEPIAFIYEKFGNRFHHVLVDEFQDTSVLQWKNLTPFISDSLASGKANMVVGDAKQSIYRWRGGKAEQLIELPELDAADDLIAEDIRRSFRLNGKIIPLTTNYRSLPLIVEFNNQLIKSLTQRLTQEGSLFRKEYSDESAVQKVPENIDGGFICWNKLDKTVDSDLIPKTVLDFIGEARQDGYGFGDIAVLVRKKGNDVDGIIKALTDANIPFVTADSFGLDKNTTVEMLLSFLRLAVDFHHSPSQIKIAREISRLHEITYEPHKIFDSDKGKNEQGFIDFLKTYDPGFNEERISGKGAYSILKYAIRSFIPVKQKTNAFIEGLLNSVLEQGGRGVTPSQFIEWWETQKTKPDVETGESGEEVRIMTIHKSKGLEFPVVIIPNLSWQLESKASTKWLKAKSKWNLPFSHIPLEMTQKLDRLSYSKELEAYNGEKDFDNLNLIYVAVTRAAERLYFNYGENNSKYTGDSLKAALLELKAISFSHGKQKELKNKLEGVLERICIGDRALKAARLPDKKRVEMIKIRSIDDTPFEERFRISGEGLEKSRETGVLFHRLAAFRNEKEASKELEQWFSNGSISESTWRELQDLIKALFKDTNYLRLIENSDQMNERNLTFQGEVLRPDAVFVDQNEVTIVDFKTGKMASSHIRQVKKYVAAIEKVYSNRRIQGFVVYVPEMKWVKANGEKPVQASLF